MITQTPIHPKNAELWMPDFYRRAGFYFTEASLSEVEILEPPSSTFPKIPRQILDDIVHRVRVVRNDEGKLVEAPKCDPVNETFQFGEAIGDIDPDELEVCRKALFKTVHTNNYLFKPSIEEIALQIPPEMWGVTRFAQCERAIEDGTTGLSWPPFSLVDPETGKAITPNRLHLANTTLFLE